MPQVFLLHGHLRQANAANTQLRNYNRMLHEQFEHETETLRQQLADQRCTVEQSIAAQRTVEAMARDTQAIATAEITRNRRKCDRAEKAVSSAERMCLQQISHLEDQLRRSKLERDNMRLQKDALVRAFAAVTNEVLGGAGASPDAVAQASGLYAHAFSSTSVNPLVEY